MKGKKVDSEFVSQYISECIRHNITSSDDMAARARAKIVIIDEKIKEIEKMKIERCKLLDVIYTFQKKEKIEKKDSKTLSFYKISNHNICKHICDSLKEKPVELKMITDSFSIADVIFCIKQLIEHKVICKTGKYFSKGELFEEYYHVVLKCE